MMTWLDKCVFSYLFLFSGVSIIIIINTFIFCNIIFIRIECSQM